MNRNIHYIYTIALLLLMGAATPTFAQTIKGNVYGGGRLGKVAGNTSITIESGSVETDSESEGSNIFGGGYQAEVAGNTTIDINGGEAGNVYGGGEAANIVVGAEGTGNTVVNMNGGTIHHSVYGGGLGNTTNVATSTTVTANGGTVTEDVYGGSGFGQVGATTVTINNGATVTRDVFGGGFGQNADAGAGKEAYEADVNGNASVTINKGAKISGNVYGGNNINGSPKGAITVLVDGPVDATEKESIPLILKDVFGGGKNAATTSSSNDIPAPKVTIQGCETIIERVFGGGDAASAPATDVEIWGGHIGNAFAGGNGEVVAAHVGYQADGTTEYNYGTGNTNITIKGGVIENVFGGSNTAGNIRGEVSVTVEKDDLACDMQISNLYGGGNEAPGKAGTISIVCTGDGRIENVYGGANKADITGDITLNIKGGQITNVFGGNNNSGNINGAITVNVNWDTKACGRNSLTNVYGGGNLAPYATPNGKFGPTVNLINGTINNNVYGGGLGEAAKVTGSPIVTLEGATVGTTATIAAGTGGRIFGGGDAAPVVGNPTVTATAGSADKIFAGGKGATAVVTGNPTAVLNKTDEKILTLTEIYGGGDEAEVAGSTTVTLTKGEVTNAFGGGNAAAINGTTAVTITNATASNVYGGGNLAGVSQTAIVAMSGGNVTTGLYGGCNSEGAVTGNIAVNVTGGQIGTDAEHKANVHGGGYGSATQAAGNVAVAVNGAGVVVYGDIYGGSALGNVNDDTNDNTTVTITDGTIHGDVYGGGLGDADNAALVNGNVAVKINGGKVNGSVYGCNNTNGTPQGTVTIDVIDGTISNNVFGGGNLADATVSPVVTVSGGTVTHDVYGGGALANVFGNTSVVISGGTSGDVYGGGLGSADIAASVGNTSVRVTGGSANNVFGCNNTNGAPTGTVNVEVAGGTVNENVFGGGNLASATVNPIVTVSGGTVTNDVYGGGALADVRGNTTVNLTGGAVGGAYGGALGSAEVVAKVYGDTYVHLDGSKVTETGIFGANNLNGTPTGHVKVHVTKTMPRDGQGAEEYDVPAVYGGGNLSAYEPDDDNDYAEVLIENCENSINYVYGGGNAAPVPATQVTIYGANAINYAFAGGNGYGAGNPGADVGYKGYYSKGSREKYGSGETHIKIYGGTINHVFGGSNTLGYIRTHAYVEVLNVPDGDTEHNCELHLGEVQAGGNEAEMYCGGSVTLACSEGAEVVYAGSSDADIHGDINLVITSGTYGKVFGGNNHSGNVYGGITINIDETGCWPVMIGELYACGNEAPYSIYGYNDNGSCKTSGEPQYTDPTINLISFTRIGKVFGGGYGNTAVAYGNPTVNVEPIKGIFAGKKPTPIYVLNDKDQRALLSKTDKLPYGITKEGSNLVIPDEAGSIGTIYGGGNAGAVYGNTNVKIGTKTTNKHVSGTDKTTEYDVAVTITGNVFGGGNEAIVSGDTNVTIGQ